MIWIFLQNSVKFINVSGNTTKITVVNRKLTFPDYVTTAQDGGKFVSLTYRQFFTPRKYSWYAFLLETEWTPGP